MRKVLLFLLVLGGGVLILWFATRHREERRQDAAPTPIAAPEDVDEQVPAEIPTGDGAEDTVRVVMGGRRVFTQYDEETGRKAYTLRNEDSRQLEGDRYELLDVEVETFDPKSGERRAVLTAERAEAVIVPGEAGLEVDEDTPVRFEDAVLVIEESGRLAPVTISLPWVDVWPNEDRFDSDAPVTVDGVGLSARSLGLEVRDLGRRMTLPAQGDVRFRREDGSRARLHAQEDGVIEVERVEGADTDVLTVTASEGARFLWRGERPLAVEARRIRVRAEVRGGEDAQRYRILEATARDEVVLRVGLPSQEPPPEGDEEADPRPEEAHFESDLARFSFDAGGELVGATLTGSPSGFVAGESEDEGGGPSTRIELRGAGPLAVGFGDTRDVDLDFDPDDLDPSVAFAMEGPGLLELAGVDARLTATERLTGVFDRRQRRARAKLSGEVAARSEVAHYRGSELDLWLSEDADGEPSTVAKSAQPARIRSLRADELPDDAVVPDPWSVETGGDLELLLRPEELRVQLATDVFVESDSDPPLALRAGRLIDLAWNERTFRADQGVRFRTPRGEGSARSVEAVTATRRLFSGTQENPVVFVLAGESGFGDDERAGRLAARQVWVWPGVVQAEGDVDLSMRAEDGLHELNCDRALLRSALLAEDVGERPEGDFHLEAYGVRRALLRTPEEEVRLDAARLDVRGRVQAVEAVEADEAGGSKLVVDEYVASGGVVATVIGAQELTLEGRRLAWTEAGGGAIEPDPDARVRASGKLPESGLPFELTADRLEFGLDSLHAVRPVIEFEAQMRIPEGEDAQAGRMRRVSANHLVADPQGALFTGDVHLTGLVDAASEVPWTLDAGSLHLSFEGVGETEELTAANVREIIAWDGVRAELGPDQSARAELLVLDYRRMRLEGAPAVFDLRGFVWESTHLEFDVVDVLISTEQGTIRAAPESELAGWTVHYESLRPFPREDDTILALRGVVGTNGREEVRADWMLFWVDRDEWRRSAEGWLDVPIDATGIRFDRPQSEEVPRGPRDTSEDAGEDESEHEDEGGETPNVFGALDVGEISNILREVYLEGDVHVVRDGRHASRFDAIYIDLVDGHGWVEGAELSLELEGGEREERVSVKSDLLRHSSDGSLHADAATVTTCTFAEPEYVVETGDLSLIPDKDPDVSWRVSVRKNSLRVFEPVRVSLPLPSIKNAPVDQRGRPVIPGISFGQSSRYGNFVRFGFSQSVGDTVRGVVAEAANVDPEDVDGNYSLGARWLSSRGLLVRGELDFDVGERFHSELSLSGIDDSDEDVGLVRAPEGERDPFRWSLIWRSRYLLDDEEWFDLVVARSSDVGFQPEFYENEFLEYEERRSYLHWRKARGEQYYSANLEFRLDDYRNAVEELPSAGVYDGLDPVGELFGEPLFYRGESDVAYLRRRTGRTPFSPFDPVFADSLGQRETARILTEQRLELPVHLGGSGVRLTPYTTLAGRFWSKGVDPDESPARAALFAGAELSGEFHKLLPGGYTNSIIPMIGFRGDLADVEEGGDPIPFDTAEDTLVGNFVDLGLRTRFTRPQDRRRLDLGIRTSYAYETTDAEDEGWQPISVLGEFYTEYREIPIGLTYDMRFDPEESATVYSRSALGVEPWEPLALELGYNRGLDPTFTRLYEAATIAARWDINWKWNIEGRQTLSLRGDDNLYSEVTLRRYGHDLVLELTWGQRLGEGSSFSFGIEPAVGYELDNLGLLDSWHDLGKR